MISTGTRPGPVRRLTRRALVGVVASGMLASGCGFVNTDDGGGTGPLNAFVSSEQLRGLEPLLDTCQKQAGIELDVQQAAVNDLNQQLRVQLSSGTAPDLFRVSPGNSSPVAAGVLGRSGALSDLSDSGWVDRLDESSRTLATVDDAVLAYPTSRNAIVVAYNKDVFTELGLEPPTTWPEWLRANDAIAKSGRTPIAAGLAQGVAIQFFVYGLAASLVYGPEPDIEQQFADGTTDFSSSAAWRTVFERFLELKSRGHLSEDALGLAEDQAFRQVAGGEAGMMVLVSAGLSQLTSYAEGGSEDIGVFAMPATDQAADTRIATAPDFLAVNAESDRAAEARRLLDCLAQGDHVDRYAKTLGSLPGLEVDGATGAPELEPIRPLLAEGRSAPFANYVWPNADIQQRLLQSGQELFGGTIDVDELLRQLDAEYAKGRK